MSFGGRNPQFLADISALKLSGMRVGPLDPQTKLAKVGLKPEAHTRSKDFNEQTIFVKKDLSGFGAGFKIPEEYRLRKLQMKADKRKKNEIADGEELDDNQVTKDEIFQLLNLGNAEGGIGSGKYGADSKKALANDLVDGLEKDLEKLKRKEENICQRKLRTMKGGAAILEETDMMRQAAIETQIENDVLDEGAHILGANQKRLQLLRHKAGQLDSLKDLSLQQLELQRIALAQRSEELSDAYFGKKENSMAGKMIRQKMGYKDDPVEEEQPAMFGADRVGEDDEAVPIGKRGSSKSRGRRSKSKSVRIAEGELGPSSGPKFGNKPLKSAIRERDPSEERDLNDRRGRSHKSNSRTREFVPEVSNVSPRRQIYEAKFDKFKANKTEKDKITARHAALKPADFDITTKDTSSPSKRSKRFKPTFGASVEQAPSGKFEPDQLMPDGYENHLMREELLRSTKDPFKLLGVSNEDKMAFFLLKWVFNAIKQESDKSDEKLKGASYVTKPELVKQLVKNPELMSALEVSNPKSLQEDVKIAACSKDGTFTWQEFLDFFFLKEASFRDRIDGNDWWQKLDNEGQPIKEPTPIKSKTYSENSDKENFDENADTFEQKKSRRQRLLAEFDEVKITPALEMLILTRQNKVTHDVEEDFTSMQQKQMGFSGMQGAKSTNKKSTAGSAGFATDGVIGQEEIDAQLGIAREKSQCLLLPSQIETMKQEYEKLDKYNDQILKRSDYLMHLRTEQRVVDFIDVNAVRVAAQKKKILSLDAVLTEIERDETYEQMQMSKKEDAINHKEFITWREFLNYFEDYREIEERNKKTKQIEKTREKMLDSAQKDEHVDEQDEFKSLMETEKERRLKELPTIRQADQIDVTEEQLQLIKDIYDSNKEPITNVVNTVTFFMAVRKHPEMRTLNTAIARDPEGCSRIARETFMQVFDRMERDFNQKQIDWATIIEFFTKFGRPLTHAEVKKLQDEDKRIREEQEEIKRRDEEDEYRKMARLKADIDGEEDYDAYQKRLQKEEGLNKDLEQDDLARSPGDNDSKNGEYDSEYDDEDDDDFDRADMGTGLMRNNSAKGLGGTNLRNQRLSNADYVSRDRGKSNKGDRKGRYGVTVPKPFAFDIRDAVKPKTIRERKVEQMVLEKQIDEEGGVKHQFRSKPIPAAVLVPRYQSILDKNEERRLKVKQDSIAITKQREAPFDFWERDKAKMAAKRNADANAGLVSDCRRPAFKANPIPAFSAIPFYEKNMQQKEEEREKRIKKHADESYARAKMPSRMEQASLDAATKPPKAVPEEFSFKPLINLPKNANQFKRMQDNFQNKLNKTKSEATVTVPRSPNFSKPKSKPLERAYVNEGKPPTAAGALAQATGGDKLRAALAAKSTKSKTSQGPVKQPSSTRASALQQQQNREKMEANKAEKERKDKEDAERIRRNNILKTTVQGALKASAKNQDEINALKVKAGREDMKKKEREIKDSLKATCEKGRQRPMLIDSYNTGTARSNLAKLRTLKTMTEIMKETGNTQKQIDKIISPADKEILEEDAYLTKQKERYNKTRPGDKTKAEGQKDGFY